MSEERQASSEPQRPARHDGEQTTSAPAPAPAAPSAQAPARTVTLPPEAHVTPLGPLPGQGEGRAFALVSEGLPLPPGGAGYVVELAGAGATGARVVGYADEFGRAFAADDVLPMPPARRPDVRLLAPAEGRAGSVMLAGAEDADEWEVAGVEPTGQGRVRLADARVELGPCAGPMGALEALCVSYLAFFLLPREQGVELVTMDVSDVFGCLRAPDLFEGLGRILKAADVAAAHPLLRPPGIIAYLARELRAAGVAGKTLADLAAPTRVPPVEGLTWAVWGEASQGAAPMLSPTPPPATPEVRLVRTTDYADMFYVAFHANQVSDEGALTLLEVEAILNRFLLSHELVEGAGALAAATPQDCSEVDLWVVENILSAGEELRAQLVAGDVPARADMDVRMALARACESLRLPYRLEYRFRYVAGEGRLVMDVGCPSARLMPRERADASGAWVPQGASERQGEEARYAFHLAILMGMAAFSAGTRVSEATVNVLRSGWSEPGDETCVLSVTFARAAFTDALRAADISARAASAGAEAASERLGTPAHPQDAPAGTPWYAADPFAFVKMFPHAFGLGPTWELTAVRPLASTDDEACLPEACMTSPEEDERPLGPAARGLLGCERVCDVSIYEDAPRRPLAREILDALAESDVSAQLAAVRDVHDRTENLLVRAACLKISDGIAAGTITAQTPGAVKALLSDVYGLQSGLKAAVRQLAKDPLGAVGSIESLIAQADGAAWFADSPTRAYRYFDCYASRAIYAYRCAEGDLAGRELRLAADEYYLAHHRLATLLSSSIERGEAAIDHARRCVELGPSVAASYLRLARCYFSLFDYRSEVETLKRMLHVAWNPADVGMALYWMGYAYWMLGEKAVGTACYQRSLAFDPSLAESVAAELSEFMRKDGLRPDAMLPDAEMDALFEEAGVPIKDVFANVAFLVRCSEAVLDAGSYRLAQNLLGSAAALMHDDAMAPVLESLGE